MSHKQKWMSSWMSWERGSGHSSYRRLPLLNDLKVNGDSKEEDIFDNKVDGRTLPRPGRSNLNGRKNYESSCSGRMLKLDELKLRDPTSEESRIFRLRFRIPFAMFELLLSWVNDWLQNTVRLGSSDCTGRQSVSTPLKLLGVLRILCLPWWHKRVIRNEWKYNVEILSWILCMAYGVNLS